MMRTFSPFSGPCNVSREARESASEGAAEVEAAAPAVGAANEGNAFDEGNVSAFALATILIPASLKKVSFASGKLKLVLVGNINSV